MKEKKANPMEQKTFNKFTEENISPTFQKEVTINVQEP